MYKNVLHQILLNVCLFPFFSYSYSHYLYTLKMYFSSLRNCDSAILTLPHPPTAPEDALLPRGDSWAMPLMNVWRHSPKWMPTEAMRLKSRRSNTRTLCDSFAEVLRIGCHQLCQNQPTTHALVNMRFLLPIPALCLLQTLKYRQYPKPPHRHERWLTSAVCEIRLWPYQGWLECDCPNSPSRGAIFASANKRG